MTVKRLTNVLVVGGLIAASVGFRTAFWAAMFAFVYMDNPPPDPLWVPAWDIGRFVFAIGIVSLVLGLVLGIAAWVRRVLGSWAGRIEAFACDPVRTSDVCRMDGIQEPSANRPRGGRKPDLQGHRSTWRTEGGAASPTVRGADE